MIARLAVAGPVMGLNMNVARSAAGLVARRLVVLALIVGAGGPLALAAPASAAQSSPGLELLHKMQDAARGLDYAGVYTYQQGTTVLSTRIVHIVDGTGERERIVLLDGQPREYIRHNDTTQCLLPDQKVVLVERRESDRFPAILFGSADNIPEHYDLKLGDTPQRVAGRDCHELTLAPRDAQRYGYKLCADRASGLLLRAQTVGPEGVLTQVVFNTLDIGKDVSSDALSPGWNTKGWKRVDVSVTPVDLAAEGWRIPLPAGYAPLTQVVRRMKAGHPAKQLVASDGLSAISVFIEDYDPAADSASASRLVRDGSVSAYRKRVGDHWLTVLGEVPVETVRALADGTEYVPLAAR